MRLSRADHDSRGRRPPSSRAVVRPAGATPPAPPGPGPRSVDADVLAAVEATLGEILAERVASCAALDPLFGDDLAARLAGFTLGGGKRTRPRLLWWSFRACGGRDQERAAAALRIAAALELLQSCALVHDDVMDDSSLRRGRPALHTAVARQYGGAEEFGRSAALLAGDLALAWADDEVAETCRRTPGTGPVLGLWRDLRTEMVAGQYLDLHGQLTAARAPDRAVRVACLKSARYSVERPIALGAALAGAPPRTSAELSAAGRCAGVAFQLRDDLHGVFGRPHTTGKPSGDDLRQGKPTYLLAVARVRAEARRDTEALAVLDLRVGDASLTEEQVDDVREVLERTGARAAVERRIERLATRSLRHLTAAGLPAGPGDRHLRDLLRTAAGARSPVEARAGTGAAAPSGAAVTVGAAAAAGPPPRTVLTSALREEA
ncbi:polyprenyl synthetase family protein [Streptomyces ziwulingensis]|uniref:Polyprenyl synthetase family protein n=1 Tax=Streptomyces ziwulingensis TaxID=1045501 RepID=A0ABP9BR67_9ACTN